MAVAAAVGQKLWWRDVLALTKEPDRSASGAYILSLVARLRKQGEVTVYSRLLKEAVERVAYDRGLFSQTRRHGPGWRIELVDMSTRLR